MFQNKSIMEVIQFLERVIQFDNNEYRYIHGSQIIFISKDSEEVELMLSQLIRERKAVGLVSSYKKMMIMTNSMRKEIKCDESTQEEKRITQLDDIQPSMDPKNRRPFMSTMITCRDELRIAKKENLSVRKAALKNKIEEDYKAMESALIRMGLGFITTHP